jgi:hypothetical protein
LDRAPWQTARPHQVTSARFDRPLYIARLRIDGRRMGRSVALAGLLVIGVGCGTNDVCGPGEAADEIDAVRVGGDNALELRVTTSSAGDHCSDPDAPGIQSILVEGEGRDAPLHARIALCIARPDRLHDGAAVTFGSWSSTADVRLQTLRGILEPCEYALDHAMPFTGTARANGVCGTGDDGFALGLDSTVVMTETCFGQVRTLEFRLAGTIAVPAR